MKESMFFGVCTALVTPFLNANVNYPMMEQLLKKQISAGVSAVVLAGTTGEASTLSDSEKIELFRRGKQYVGNSCGIIAGTGSNSTQHAIQLSVAAQEVGADALLIVTPYYNKATPDGLYAHYLSIAQSVDLPIILYNVPSRTGVDIPISVYQRLCSIPNIIGVKEACGDITKITKILAACPNFHVWSGNDDMIVPTVALGGCGVISVLSNLYPEETVIMVNAARAGDYKTAAEMQRQMQPLVELLFCEVNPIPVKSAMKLLGYDCGSCRLPLTDLSSMNQKRLEVYLCKRAPVS